MQGSKEDTRELVWRWPPRQSRRPTPSLQWLVNPTVSWWVCWCGWPSGAKPGSCGVRRRDREPAAGDRTSVRWQCCPEADVGALIDREAAPPTSPPGLALPASSR